MKKLLSLIVAFNITILTSLTSVACNESDANQETTDSPALEAESQLSTIQEEEFFEQNDIDSWTTDETESISEESSASSPTSEQTLLLEESKEDLSAVTNLHISNLEANLTQKYSVLNSTIIGSNVFEHKRVRKGFRIKYYNAQTDGAEITANNQNIGTVWVEIIAHRINPLWKGKTNRIAITLIAATEKFKTNLSTVVDKISAIRFRANQTYSSLNQQIIKNITEFKTKPLAAGYQIDYYTPGSLLGINKIDSNNIQKIGTVYIKITAALNDQNWTGVTDKLIIELKESIKVDLNTIRDGLFSPISNSIFKVNTVQSYNSLNSGIIQKLNQLAIFKTKPLAKGFQIKYYSRNLFIYSEKKPTDKQTAGNVWVEIIANPADRFWTGSTKFKIRLTV